MVVSPSGGGIAAQAAGPTLAAGSEISGPGVDLSDSDTFNFRDTNQGHSAQYYSNYAERSRYWITLLESFGQEE